MRLGLSIANIKNKIYNTYNHTKYNIYNSRKYTLYVKTRSWGNKLFFAN